MAPKTVRFEDFLQEIGGFGRYQKFIFLCLLIVSIHDGFLTCSFMFILTVPDHRCAIPGLPNDTYAIQDEAHNQLINASIPEDEDYKSCYLIRDPGLSSGIDAFNTTNGTSSKPELVECHRWVYDKSVFTFTAIEEMNLVCDRAIYRAHANMAMMVGKGLASFFLTAVPDVFGRQKTLLVLFPLTIATCFANAFLLVNIPLLLLLRGLYGFMAVGTYYSALVLCLELSSNSKRNSLNVIFNTAWTVGAIIVTGMSYFLPNYVHFNLFIAVTTLFYIPYMWFLPESPRWLLTKGRFEDARKVLKKMATVNKTIFPEDSFERLLETEYATQLEVQSDGKANGLQMENRSPGTNGMVGDEKLGVVNGEDVQEKKSLTTAEVTVRSTQKKKSGMLELVRNRTLLWRCCIACAERFIVGLVYYAIMFNVSNLSGSAHLNFTILCIVDLFSNLPVYFIVDKWGRKWSYFVCMLVATVGCFAALLPGFFMTNGASETEITYNVLAMVGRLGASAGFAILILYTAELFPTTIRLAATGVTNLSSKVGSSIAPYIADLGILIGGPMADTLPLVSCGAAGAVGIVLVLTLPETANKDLPDNTDEAVDMERSSDTSGSSNWTEEGEPLKK